MADQDDLERTESPTEKRLEDARRRGQVPRSRDLGAAAITLAAGAGLYGLGPLMGAGLAGMMRAGLELPAAATADPTALPTALASAAARAALAVAPLLGLLLAAAVLAPLAIGGWNFSVEALQPRWDRLDPVAGLQRVFSARGLIELLKALARFVVVALVAVLLLRNQLGQYAALGVQPVGAGISHALHLAAMALITLGAALGGIALVDVPLALWQHHRSLRMSRQEIREESKESEGNPEVRGRVRRAQQTLARRRMMEHVPTADVVVTNPTHYAVALRYDERRMRAPIVVAKGADLIALRIREIAAEHDVPLVEAPPLARALHAGCELGDEIPARLYAVVAQLLTYVYQLRTARRAGTAPPPSPELGPVDAPGSPAAGQRP